MSRVSVFSLPETLALASWFVLNTEKAEEQAVPKKREKDMSRVSMHVRYLSLSCLHHSCLQAFIKFQSWGPVHRRNERGEYFRLERDSSPLRREHVISLSLYGGRVGDGTMAGKV